MPSMHRPLPHQVMVAHYWVGMWLRKLKGTSVLSRLLHLALDSRQRLRFNDATDFRGPDLPLTMEFSVQAMIALSIAQDIYLKSLIMPFLQIRSPLF
jgi:hypothetical protein